MGNYKLINKEETLYLDNTLNFLKKELTKDEYDINFKKRDLITSRRDMWQESAHSSNDFDKIPEMLQHLSEVDSQNYSYEKTLKRIKKYTQILNSPYFGRFDFKEDGYDDLDKIYIGLYNLIDKDTSSILIYDWRSPISSMFYQFEIGKGSYNAPFSVISGDITMKRQYKIKESKLQYFFDSSVTINDEILQEVLSHNSSSTMKNIVETIQKQQDIIIRDTENELLIVQGVAGSGKTSIALHRIAYLLYVGMGSKIHSNNIIIISPSSVFSKYISGVLPELGEDNVEETTFDNIIVDFLDNRFIFESRKEQLESLIINNNQSINIKMENTKFKGSKTFVIILDRLIYYYEHNLTNFEDLYYDGKIIETKQQLNNLFLNGKMDMPISKRLKRIESMMLNKIHPLRKARLQKIQKIVLNATNHQLEIKSFSRLLAIKEAKVLMGHIHKYTQVDYANLYKLLFNKSGLFLKLSKGLELPKDIKQMILKTIESLHKDHIDYEDCAPLLYIKLKLNGNREFSDIQQVVIDEAQDYYPLQYEVFNLLFARAKFTILGDFNQTLEKHGNKFIYDDLEDILHKKKSLKLSMNKSFRSSIEINSFTQKILNSKEEFVSFDRHEDEPIIVFKDNEKSIYEAIILDIHKYENLGYESIAVICKTQQEALIIEKELIRLDNIKLLNIDDTEIIKGTVVIPSYISKGLEFDVVLVFNVSKNNYNSEFDRNLLYVACTRALHQLVIYYTGEKSDFF
ncbi:AAA family ATPase [Clostridium estertheticum]|uniref:AAA family ATPase n=1 Tax=Clostridium estertheticum TaxID=238834 RepID=A0AA47EEH6_9CLOT|nr:UvrD-helicase domain-containing protein [Clostridium estertheticum]MBU3157980.1 AAA family ATPase [Clostridium estertheticum]MBU3199445.1 AAA family ATPase [Clostridium estertheticum]WAG58652.1 AAA family ATPase [Clostridium estertheticum]WAG67311.1 AAA family ATPase [Clostridium estertheticum]